ncbi:hypothetical protein LCGC14_1369950 [marine sediment metagenome]|uniref:HNH nuclease domain-containing protein n=1 Tax=marine sediment metagenome TaxID=412755 RepID=A0A0F9KRK8_9ZZZZ
MLLEWRPIPDAPMYEASNMGSVRRDGRCLLLQRTGNGYLKVSLSVHGKALNRKVHRLVLETFIGPRPDGMVCRHANGSRLDNRLVNLSWGTQKQNMADAIRHGTTNRGGPNRAAKLTADDVVAIRRRYVSTYDTCVKIVEDYPVNASAIEDAVSGRNWGWLYPQVGHRRILLDSEGKEIEP